MAAKLSALLLLLFTILAAEQGAQQPAPFNISQKIKAISDKYRAASSYLCEGEMTIEGQKGSGPLTQLRKAHFKVGNGEDGKSFYEMHLERQDDYQIISNGQKTWTVLPEKKQYTVEESASASDGEDGEEVEGGDMTNHYARLVVPALKDLFKNAKAAGYFGLTGMKIDGNKGNWPTVRIELQPNPAGAQSLVELVFDPDSLGIGRMTYANVSLHDGERTVIRAIMQFD